ncbi:hypothetical protein NE236_23095 [Actinoallomurus purpureus]|uniref:hypothetical protein n=1 Tax=Actinoallomurus purpureus TaxID=478114 RepID=UPI002093C8AA|nr:hypothetical protein [Actinoallomurus purpureus]MCO6007870.1 hypothetical protein [Actinoallomurus purpureus]
MATPGERVRTHIPPPREIWPISELVRQVGRLVAEELERPVLETPSRDVENAGDRERRER